jgi:hypothetical protein
MPTTTATPSATQIAYEYGHLRGMRERRGESTAADREAFVGYARHMGIDVHATLGAFERGMSKGAYEARHYGS